MQQQTRLHNDYASALTLMHELLGIDPDSPTIIDYAGGLLFSSELAAAKRRGSLAMEQQEQKPLLDRSMAFERYLELSRAHPGAVVAVVFDGGRFIGQFEPSRPAHGGQAKPVHAVPRQG